MFGGGYVKDTLHTLIKILKKRKIQILPSHMEVLVITNHSHMVAVEEGGKWFSCCLITSTADWNLGGLTNVRIAPENLILETRARKH